MAVFAYVASYTTSLFRNITPSWPHFAREKDSHNTWNFMPYSLRTVCGFFNVPRWNFKHRCNYKGSTFSSVILRPWVLVWPESNSWPPEWQPNAQPTELPLHGLPTELPVGGLLLLLLLFLLIIIFSCYVCMYVFMYLCILNWPPPIGAFQGQWNKPLK